MPIDHDKIKRTLEGARFQGWKPRSGDNHIFVLPPHSRFLKAMDELDNVAIPYRLHYFKMEGRQTEVTRCLEDERQPCPACQVYRAFGKSTDPGLKELAIDVRASTSYLINVLDMNNPSTGVQRWSANYTCWSKIMEIVANAQWGDVVDPMRGITFQVNLTPGSSARSGYNTYSVVPLPAQQENRVVQYLAALPTWKEDLDVLEYQTAEAKTPDEIVAILDEMGFPATSGQRTIGKPASASFGGGAAAPPSPVAPPAPTPTAPPAPAPAVVPPTPPAAPPPAPPAVGSAAPHYDPGPAYQPKVADADRPAGAPRCFGDYNPTLHRCQPCPVMSPCQMRMLGVG